MKIRIDGEPAETGCTDVAALLASLGHAPEAVATAVNGCVVPRGERASTPLAEGDAVEVLVPMFGG